MKLAYADPPYLGCGRLYAEHHADALLWDDPETHRSLVNRLCSEYPDGWAMSLSSPSLRVILPMCPDDCRVAAWIKPFAAFKPNVNPAYAWEPVIFRGGRRGDRKRDTVQDFVVANITLKKGLTGAKPVKFCEWVLDLLGYERGDTLDDLFPGTGVMGRVLASSRQQLLSLEKAMTDDDADAKIIRSFGARGFELLCDALDRSAVSRSQRDGLPTIDRGQMRLNGGSYCFHIERGNYCGRAKHWAGHDKMHRFVETQP